MRSSMYKCSSLNVGYRKIKISSHGHELIITIWPSFLFFNSDIIPQSEIDLKHAKLYDTLNMLIKGIR